MPRKFLYLLYCVCFIIFALLYANVSQKSLQPNGIIHFSQITDDIGLKHILLYEAAHTPEESQQFVLSLKNGTVVNEGAIITNTQKILIDTQTAVSNQHSHLLKKGRDINLENPLFFKGRLVVISSPGQENWYHFLLQVLPRLKILKDSGLPFDRIYINNLEFPWQTQALNVVLNALDIPEDKILAIKGDVIIQADTLIVPSVPFIPCKGTPLPAWLKKFLNDLFVKPGSLNVSEPFIYISRSKARNRQVTNEAEVIDFLKTHGFKIVYLEDISVFEQAELFHQAKIIIGPHGSGFANLIFAQPNTKIIEIDHDCASPRSFYRRFSEIMACSYHPFYVDTVIEDHLEDDLTVDIKKLQSLIEKIKN